MGFFDMFSNSNEKKARDAQIQGLNRGRSLAFGNLNQGEQAVRGSYGAADALYQPQYDRYQAGSGLYADALGVNGAGGTQHAQDAFQTGPGYGFQVSEALKGVLRNSSATGNLASGNTLTALQDRGNQLANQEFGGWLDRLSGYDSNLAGATAGRAGIKTGLGDRLLGLAGDRAGINWAAETGAGQARGQYQLGKDQTSQNIFGAIVGGLKLGTKLLGMGGMPGGGGGGGGGPM